MNLNLVKFSLTMHRTHFKPTWLHSLRTGGQNLADPQRNMVITVPKRKVHDWENNNIEIRTSLSANRLSHLWLPVNFSVSTGIRPRQTSRPDSPSGWPVWCCSRYRHLTSDDPSPINHQVTGHGSSAKQADEKRRPVRMTGNTDELTWRLWCRPPWHCSRCDGRSGQVG